MGPTLHATGGGAHKFRQLFESELGLKYDPQDELGMLGLGLSKLGLSKLGNLESDLMSFNSFCFLLKKGRIP